MLVAAAASAILFVVVLATMLQGRGTASGSPTGVAGASASVGVPSGSGGAGSPPASGAAILTPVPTGAVPPSSAALPVRVSALEVGTGVWMEAAPDGGLYVAVPASDGVVAFLLDSDGEPRPGWPVRVAETWCQTMLVAVDGSLRMICEVPPTGDGLEAPLARVHAFDPAGQPLPNWPIEIEQGFTARMVGNDLHVLISPYEGDVIVGPAHIFMAVIPPDGVLSRGTDVPLFDCCDNSLAIAPDGTGYMRTIRFPEGKSEILAFDQAGAKAGWPVSIDGQASPLAFDAASRVYVGVAAADATMWTVVFDAAGQVVGGAQGPLPYSSNPWTGAGAEGPGPLFVADDGTYFLFSAEDGSTIAALARDGEMLAGWPYHSDRFPQQTGFCPEGDTGCGYNRSEPVVGPGNVLYASLSTAASSAGGRLVAIGNDGRVRGGWPVDLVRAGSMFWSLEAGTDGVWALAVEPEASGASATILSIAEDSTVRWKTTIIEP